jgi:hypothetical protein
LARWLDPDKVLALLAAVPATGLAPALLEETYQSKQSSAFSVAALR